MIWFDGWREVHVVVLADLQAHRFDDGVWLRRVECSACGWSRTLWPPFVYPRRTYEPCINETAVLAYLSEPAATYRSVAARFGCAPSTVWRWVQWASDLGEAAAIVSEAARADPAGPVAPLIPREVPQSHPKAKTATRRAALLRAFQLLVAVALLAHSEVHPPDDPSALRWWLHRRFLGFHEVALVSVPAFSPAWKQLCRGPPR